MHENATGFSAVFLTELEAIEKKRQLVLACTPFADAAAFNQAWQHAVQQAKVASDARRHEVTAELEQGHKRGQQSTRSGVAPSSSKSSEPAASEPVLSRRKQLYLENEMEKSYYAKLKEAWESEWDQAERSDDGATGPTPSLGELRKQAHDLAHDPVAYLRALADKGTYTDKEKLDDSTYIEEKTREHEERLLIEARRLGQKANLLGLALSGGGIRSATFNLGVLQGLAELGILRHFDYLSTVSGGGYIGSWLAAWFRREGRVDTVEKQLSTSRRIESEGRLKPDAQGIEHEPEPVGHLRAYSSYLAPRRGLFSADSWVLLAIYGRNITLNQLVLLPALAALLLIPRLLEHFFNWSVDAPLVETAGEWLMLGVVAFALVCIIGRAAIVGSALEERVKNIPLQWGVRLYHLLILVPLFAFAVLISWDLSWAFAPESQSQSVPWWDHAATYLPWDQAAIEGWELEKGWQNYPVSGSLLFGSIAGCLVVASYLLVGLLLLITDFFWPARARPGTGRPRTIGWKGMAWAVASGFLSGGLGGACLYLVFALILDPVYDEYYDVAVVTVLGPPLSVVVIVLSVAVAVGLLGTLLADNEREWWASLSGWLLMYASAWLVFVGISLLGSFALAAAGNWGRMLLASGWLTTAVAGILAGKSSRTSTLEKWNAMEWLAIIAPPVFLVGLLLLLVSAIDWAQNIDFLHHGHLDYEQFSKRLKIGPDSLLWVMVACATGALLLALRVNVNAFSLHGLYANRLVRCYLGASRPKVRHSSDRLAGASTNSLAPYRQPDPITGFDPEDDLPISTLQVPNVTRAEARLRVERGGYQDYWGPVLLVNTAMNLTQGDELAWQERKAESFVLSAYYVGSESTGYRRLDPTDGETPSLGTAMALSGAAVSPNMGYHSMPAVTALLTIFNVRLGGWMGNPRVLRSHNAGPRLGLLYLAKELLGRTNARAPYVYLSDGGHFDNLGVYELVRRRCRYIVVCDAEQDNDYSFAGLGAVVLKCQIDFGIRIEIDIDSIRPRGRKRRSLAHCAIGIIRYDDVDDGADPGILLYVKASLTGDEPADLYSYARQHATFPHHTTLDQFFKESQIECYRALGHHCIRAAFSESVLDKLNWGSSPSNASLFSALRDHWLPSPPEVSHVSSFALSPKGGRDPG